jgi:hypothetical protein
MNGPSELAALVRSLSPQQVALRLMILASPVVGFVAVAEAGRGAVLPFLVILLATPATAIRPDSHAGTVVVASFAWMWAVAVDDVRTPWALLGALAVLAFHGATALATIAPPTARIPATIMLRWLRRAAVVLAGTVTAWGGVIALEEAGTRANVALAAAGAVAVVGLATLLRPRRA